MTSEIETPKHRGPVWLVWTIAILFAVLYSYPLWVGVGNAIGVPQAAAASYDLGISPAGWTVLILGVLVSPAFFVVGLFLGRKRGAGAKALIYATGLCAVSAVMTSLIAAPNLIDFLS